MITIIPTAHISKESVEEVRDKILELKPDVVAVELCPVRYKGLTEGREIPIIDLIKSKKSSFVIANILLSFLQRRLGEEVGVKPGKEMLIAIDTAKELGVEYALIDRDIKITLNRAFSKMTLLEKLRAIKEMIYVFSLSATDVEKEIENVKKEENLEEILNVFKKISPNLFETLVTERDAYMASKLLELQAKYENILVVVGAGHKRGIEDYLSNPNKIPPTSKLVEIPKKRVSIGKSLKYGVPAFVMSIFILALYHGISLEQPIMSWILLHSIPTFLMVLLVGGSFISAIVGMLAAPFTSLNPMLAAGWFAGLAEIKVKKVTVRDVSDIFKTTSFRELLRNKAFKVLLVTAFANLGSSLGTLVSFQKIMLPLIKNLLG
jgi:pheromone shutdown-related protein TraB